MGKITRSVIFETGIGFLLASFAAAISASVMAAPLEYPGLARDQKLSYQPDSSRLLRIWMVYIGQGDGLLLQLPKSSNAPQGVEILIDGGAEPQNETDRLTGFLEALYPDGVDIEYAVLTHHDSDHTLGLISTLKSADFGIRNIFHNGLASFQPGKRGLPSKGSSKGVVADGPSDKWTRAMGLVGPDDVFKPEYIIDTLPELKDALKKDELQGVYKKLAKAVIEKQLPYSVEKFDRASESTKALQWQSVTNPIRMEFLWPRSNPVKYKSWSETINGNSVSFALEYGDFRMLFTGDMNELSEEDMLKRLTDAGTLKRLDCDVFKVPHHGSAHALEAFFTESHLRPVVSVASMGAKGFSDSNWQHPSTEVIRWLGGFTRVFNTHIHERPFSWDKLTSASLKKAMVERNHILIETDGVWFRLVEIPANVSPRAIPPVDKVTTGNGTRWIRAK